MIHIKIIVLVQKMVQLHFHRRIVKIAEVVIVIRIEKVLAETKHLDCV